MPSRFQGQLTFARSRGKHPLPADMQSIRQTMLAAITLGSYHRGSWRLATHDRLSSLRAAGTALETQTPSMNYYCDTYLRIMKYLRHGRAELRHYQFAPTGLLSARVFMQPNQSLNTSTTSLRSWCSPRGVNASRSQPRDRSHPQWSMVSGTVSTTVGASRRKRRVRRVVVGGGWAGWAGAILGACRGSRAAGNPGQGAAQLPSPVTFTSQSLLQRCYF